MNDDCEPPLYLDISSNLADIECNWDEIKKLAEQIFGKFNKNDYVE